MKKIEAIIRPEKISNVKARLMEIGVAGMTLIDASGWSSRRQLHLQWRGQKIAYDLVPKIKIEMVVADEAVDNTVTALVETAKTGDGQEGDGVIFITTVDEAVNFCSRLTN